MTTDEEKCKIARLLQDIEVPEVKLTERCNDLVKEFHKKYEGIIGSDEMVTENYENPYVPDKKLLEENEKKLKELLAESKRVLKTIDLNLNATDPKRPWRTNSNKEKLLRIENELKQLSERSSSAITPIEEKLMKDLVRECQEESLVLPPVGANRLKATIDEARKNLPNFQYRIIENSTATTILPEAHCSATAVSIVEENSAEIMSKI